MRICLIIIYFGKLPPYFDIFYRSCGLNDQINFKFFTDSSFRRADYPNCEFLPMDRETFAQLTEAHTGIAPIPRNFHGYKLCEYRPAYGLIFKDYLTDFDYWGYCDMDMVLGSLQPLINVLEDSPDYVSSSTRWTHGPLSVYKNVDTVNTLFLKSKDIKRVFTDEKHYVFDESGGKKGLFDAAYASGSYRSFLDMDPSYYDNTHDIECFTSVIYRHQQNLKVVAKRWIRDGIFPNDAIIFDKGKITDRAGAEWCAFHWVMEKKLNQFGYPNWHVVPDQFYIDMFGFVPLAHQGTVLGWWYRFRRNVIGKVKDARDIVWLLRTRNLTPYYQERYEKTNPVLLRVLLFLGGLLGMHAAK